MNFAFWGFNNQLKAACAAVREELDDHLDAINANSRDTVEVRELVGVLDEKIEKLSSRLDELYLLLGAEAELTPREAALQAFLQCGRSMDEIAAFCNESAASCEHLLRCLHFKGVHIYRVGDRFTTNVATNKHIPLNTYL